MSSVVSFVRQGHEILGWYGAEPDDPCGTAPVEAIAQVARTCYRSASRGGDSDCRLVRSLVERDHGAMLEHSFLSVRFLTDRAVANEIVRHRLFSFAQESTRYVNYGRRGFEFVLPEGLGGAQDAVVRIACRRAAEEYDALLSQGASPQVARAVLPLCTATTIVVSGNFREWRHFLKLRTAPDAHPQMRALAIPLLDELRRVVPVVFDDILTEEGVDA